MDFFDKTLRSFDILGGQNAPPASDGIGVQTLYRCRRCHRIWLQDGQSAILDLSTEQVQHFTLALHADLGNLPLATCRICLWLHGGGSVSIDEYSQGEAFGFCWEIPHPVVIHAVSVIQSQKGLDQWESMPDVLTQKEKLYAVLCVLKEAQLPQNICLLPPLFGQIQASQHHPGFGQAGTEHWQWRVWSFSLPCPPLDEEKDAIVTFTLALPPAESVTPGAAFRTWRFLLELTFLSGVLENKA